jgi:hypothetical protein
MNPRENRRAPAPRPASAAPTRVKAHPEPPTRHHTSDRRSEARLPRCIRLRRLESSKKLKAEMVATPPTPSRVWLGGEKVTARSNYKYIVKSITLQNRLSGPVTRLDSDSSRAAPPRPRPGATLRLVSCIDSRSRGLALRRVVAAWVADDHIQITVTHRRLHGASGRR